MCKSQYESPSSIVYRSGDESAAMYITICPVCMPLTLVLQITHCKTCYIHSCGVHNSSRCFAHMHYICMPTWLCCFVGALWIQLLCIMPAMCPTHWVHLGMQGWSSDHLHQSRTIAGKVCNGTASDLSWSLHNWFSLRCNPAWPLPVMKHSLGVWHSAVTKAGTDRQTWHTAVDVWF